MSEALRLDKWLWQARLAKTRTLAARLIETGAVTLDGRAVKPAQTARVGGRVVIRFGRAERVIEIQALGDRRGPAAEARLLYRELVPVAPSADRWSPLIDDEV